MLLTVEIHRMINLEALIGDQYGERHLHCVVAAVPRYAGGSPHAYESELDEKLRMMKQELTDLRTTHRENRRSDSGAVASGCAGGDDPQAEPELEAFLTSLDNSVSIDGDDAALTRPVTPEEVSVLSEELSLLNLSPHWVADPADIDAVALDTILSIRK